METRLTSWYDAEPSTLRMERRLRRRRSAARPAKLSQRQRRALLRGAMGATVTHAARYMGVPRLMVKAALALNVGAVAGFLYGALMMCGG